MSVELNGKTTCYEMRWNETIKELKKKISQKEKNDVDDMDLVLLGKRLNSDEKWFQIEVLLFDHKDNEDTSVQQRLKRLLPGASGRDAEKRPVLQVVSR